MKTTVKIISPNKTLFRDPISGIAWVEDGSTGMRHSCHPNIDQSGSAAGMIARGTWEKHDILIKTQGFIHNASQLLSGGPEPDSDLNLTAIAAEACQCRGCQQRRELEQEGDRSES